MNGLIGQWMALLMEAFPWKPFCGSLSVEAFPWIRESSELIIGLNWLINILELLWDVSLFGMALFNGESIAGTKNPENPTWPHLGW